MGPTYIFSNSINEVDYQNTRKQLEQNKDNMSLKSLRVEDTGEDH